MKNFILDTNVLLFEPSSIYKFGESTVIIPLVVLEEVDKFKREIGETGRNARRFSREVDQLRSTGDLAGGVSLRNGGVLKIEPSFYENLPPELYSKFSDNKILSVALEKTRRFGKSSVTLITKDINLRIKADILGVSSDDYIESTQNQDVLFSGTQSLEVDNEEMEEFFMNKKLFYRKKSFLPNEYLIIKNSLYPNNSALGKFSAKLDCILPIFSEKEGCFGLRPKNAEQAFALDALLDDEIKLVSLVGKAGTGKTLLAIAAGLQKTVDQGVYSRVLLSRPVFPLGKDIGFLPGTINEKLNPWMQPIYDNIDFLFGSNTYKNSRSGNRSQELMNQGFVQIEPLTYIRGRSIPKQYLIIDEAQNLTPHEIKTIITRAGDDTKIVLTGDRFQIDNPYVDSINNGLVHLVERFKAEDISAHITLNKGERSKLSELASDLL